MLTWEISMARATQPLTDTLVERTKPKATQFRLWDSRVPGFGVQVNPTGRKTFLVFFCQGGRQTFKSIGTWGAWDVAQAREEAIRLRHVHEKGGDVQAVVRQERASTTIADLIETWRASYAGKRKSSTVASYESILRTSILPLLGTRLAKALTHADVRDFHAQIALKTPIQANRACAVLSKLMTIAEQDGIRPAGSNPVRKLEHTKETPKDRVLDSDELHVLEQTLTRLVEEGIHPKDLTGLRSLDGTRHRKPLEGTQLWKLSPHIADLVRFLLFSGLRRSEALSLRWDDIDWKSRTMRFIDHKGDKQGTKCLPLNPCLEAILRRLLEEAFGPYVFPGRNGDGPHKGLGKIWERLALASGLLPFTPHDLRRTFNTVCAGLGYPPQVFDLLLGHRLPGVQGVYTHLGPDGLLAQGSRDTAAWIQAAMRGKGPTSGQKWSEPKVGIRVRGFRVRIA